MDFIEIFKNVEGLAGVELLQTVLFLVISLLIFFSRDIFKWVKESIQKKQEQKEQSSSTETENLKEEIEELEVKLNNVTVFQQRIWVIERALNQSKNAMKRHFRGLPGVTEEDIEKFSLVLYKSFTEALPFMRDLLLRNHFVEMTVAAFDAYLATRPMTIISFVSEQIDDAYKKVDISVARGIVYDGNQAIVPECLEYIKTALIDCRRIEAPIGDVVEEIGGVV